MSSQQRFLLYASGIFVCYFYYGVLQERIMRGVYVREVPGSNGEKEKIEERYTYALALVFVQCVVNYAFAKGILYVWPQPEDKTSKVYLSSCSLTYVLAMVCSNMCLQWVSYPTQVVGKAAKPIPVMVLGVLLGKKSYALQKYLFVMMIVVGVVLFMYKDKSGGMQSESSLGLGEILLILSLIMDGLTAAIQERIRCESQPSGQQLMQGMNAWSSLYLGVALVLSGELLSFVKFITHYPLCLLDMSLLSLTGALGQLFIFFIVTEFGPLPCSVITTTRKFFTVLGSVVLFGNVLIARQWFGAVVVFTGLFMDAFFSKKAPKKQNL